MQFRTSRARPAFAAFAIALLATSNCVFAQEQGGAAPQAAAPTSFDARAYDWVTLGTLGGPMPSADRGQPANLLVRRGEAYLIDAGDGAMSRYVAAGAQFPWLRGVFISHLHFDHIGGLFAVIGLRSQTLSRTALTIYGPPGTKVLVDRLVAASRPSTESGYGVEGEVEFAADTGVTVVEMRDSDVLQVSDFTVRAVNNTHYTFGAGSPLAEKYQSLSFRFDLPGRSIVYTGDTGPSDAVKDLAQGADLLVTEMIDLEATERNMTAHAPSMDAKTRTDMIDHLSHHHLTTTQISELSRDAGVKQVVVTHIAGGGGRTDGAAEQYRREIGEQYPGPVTVAADLDRF